MLSWRMTMSNTPKPFIVRYFKQGDNHKMITAIQKKIYFSKDQNIDPGYYVGSIIKEKETSGEIDTMPLNKLPVNIWIENKVECVFVKSSKKDKTIKIFLSKSPDNRDKDEEPLLAIDLTDEQAEKLWGKDYRDHLVKKKNGLKHIKPSTYTPFEKLSGLKKELLKKEKDDKETAQPKT